MTFHRPLPFVALALTSLAWAADLGQDRLVEFRRDADLISTFVDSALTLSQESDPLQRAEHCQTLAAHISKELQQATAKRSTSRADELGDMLQVVLIQGVADNLRVAHEDLTPETTRAREILRVGEATMAITGMVRQSVSDMAPRERQAMQGMLQGVNKAGEQVRKSSLGLKTSGNKNKK